MTRAGPVARVRARLLRDLGPHVAEALPDGYQRLGRVLVVRLPESLRPHFAQVGEAYRAELGVATVVRRRGPVSGEWRAPDLEVISGAGTETEVTSEGVRYRFDAARVMFSEGNRSERSREGRLVGPGETVADLFAGIGYFTIPAALPGRASVVHAVEQNPESHRYLRENLRLNHVEGRVRAYLGDCRTVDLPLGTFDRVLLGLLPSALPYVPRAVSLVRPEGGWLHVHLVVGAREGGGEAARRVEAAIAAAGAAVLDTRARTVKEYGPGRVHSVVDARVRP